MSLPSSFSFVKLTAMNTKRAYKERFYPTLEQALLLAQSFGCARFVYNNTLKFRTDAYYNDGKSISHSMAEKRLVSLKAEFPFLSDISSVTEFFKIVVPKTEF